MSHCGCNLHFSNNYWCWISFHLPIVHLYNVFGEMSIQIISTVLIWLFVLLSCKIFSFMNHAFGIKSKKSLCSPRSWRYVSATILGFYIHYFAYFNYRNNSVRCTYPSLKKWENSQKSRKRLAEITLLVNISWTDILSYSKAHAPSSELKNKKHSNTFSVGKIRSK